MHRPYIHWTSILLLGLALAALSTFKFGDDATLASRASRSLRRANRLVFGSHYQEAQAPSSISPSQQTPIGTNTSMGRTPVYFFSHGGPNVMEETSHPAHHKLQEIGQEITQKVKPKAVVVFSAHWQGERDVVEVNTAESMGLIYDFYGFPAHYYSMQYPNKGSPELANKLLETFEKNGIKAEGVRRGLDHGVWAGFMVAFDPVKNPLNVPLVQVSLFDTEDPDQHYRLGQSISSLRSEDILIICSGMAVHNLRDMWKAMQLPHPMPYTISFDEALKEAVEQPVEARQKAMAELLKRPDARKAHPTFDHLLPIHVAAGAASEEIGKQIWTMPEGSMAWAQFRFGEVA